MDRTKIAPFSLNVFVDFAKLDPAGILYFGEVCPLAHSVYEQFVVEELGVSWNKWFNNESWAIPIRSSKADYFRPIRGGEELTISVEVAEVRDHSFRLLYRFKQQEAAVCVVETVHVFCERSTGKKIKIPEEVKEKLY